MKTASNKRFWAGRLNAQTTASSRAAAATTAYKEGEPGLVDLNIMHMPKWCDLTERSYLFVATEPATQWTFLRMYSQPDGAAAIDFLLRLNRAAPMKIRTVVLDQGLQFANGTNGKSSRLNRTDSLHLRAEELAIQLRMSPPHNPPSNSIRRLVADLGEVIDKAGVAPTDGIEAALQRFLAEHNERPVRLLHHGGSPVQMMRRYQTARPEPSASVHWHQNAQGDGDDSITSKPL